MGRNLARVRATYIWDSQCPQLWWERRVAHFVGLPMGGHTMSETRGLLGGPVAIDGAGGAHARVRVHVARKRAGGRAGACARRSAARRRACAWRGQQTRTHDAGGERAHGTGGARSGGARASTRARRARARARPGMRAHARVGVAQTLMPRDSAGRACTCMVTTRGLQLGVPALQLLNFLGQAPGVFQLLVAADCVCLLQEGRSNSNRR